jgi:hypothetical protein
MLSQDLIVASTQDRTPTIIEGSGRKARDRIEHFLRAAIASVAPLPARSGGVDPASY